MEEADILRHDCDCFSQGIVRQQRADFAVDEDGAGLHVVEPLYQRKDGRFSRPRWPHDTHPRSRIDFEIQRGENLVIPRIGKAHVAELYGSSRGGHPLRR